MRGVRAVNRFAALLPWPLVGVLVGVFMFNLGLAAWGAVVAGTLVQAGEGPATVGALFSAAEVLRLPTALLLPLVTLRFGTRWVSLVGMLTLGLLPLMALTNLGPAQVMSIFVLTAVPAMAVFVGLPAFVIGAAGRGHDGWALAWLGLVGGAGGAVGPWFGGILADSYGLIPALVLLCVGSLLLVPTALRGPLPPPSPWPGWSAVLSRGLPWQALAVLALASAADAGRAALVPTELVRDGLSLADTGFVLGAAAALAGGGFLAFGHLADRSSPARVLGAGLMVVVAGSFAAAEVAGWSLAYAVAGAVLGMGASGVRLGAEVALIGWVGRDRAAVAAALGETTMLGGRAVGAPVVGVLGDTRGGAYAFLAIGLAGLSLATLLVARRAGGGLRLALFNRPMWLAFFSRPLLRLACFNRAATAAAPVTLPVPVALPVVDQ
jgi:MFS family permease